MKKFSGLHTSEEILSALQAKPDEINKCETMVDLVHLFSHGKKKPIASNCDRFWRQALAIRWGDKVGVQPPLTTVSRSRLRNVVKFWADNFGVSIGWRRLARVIEYWPQFTAHCESHHGAFNSPMLPQIPYLQKFLPGVESFVTVSPNQHAKQVSEDPKGGVISDPGTDLSV